jgi:hypothetical protein
MRVYFLLIKQNGLSHKTDTRAVLCEILKLGKAPVFFLSQWLFDLNKTALYEVKVRLGNCHFMFKDTALFLHSDLIIVLRYKERRANYQRTQLVIENIDSGFMFIICIFKENRLLS